AAPGAMSTGALVLPITAFVAQSVALKANTAAPSGGARIRTPSAGFAPELMTVAKDVAVVPSCTDLIDGSTEATSVVGGAAGPEGATVNRGISPTVSGRPLVIRSPEPLAPPTLETESPFVRSASKRRSSTPSPHCPRFASSSRFLPASVSNTNGIWSGTTISNGAGVGGVGWLPPDITGC